MNKIQEYLSLLVQLTLFFFILYSVLILQNNLNLLLLETHPFLILIGIIILYFLIKRLEEFFGLGLTNLDLLFIYLFILILLSTDRFSLIIANLYYIIGFYIILEIYYILARILPIDYQLFQLEKYSKEVYRSEDGMIVIREKGIFFKYILGSYSQQIKTLPGGKLDDLYKLLLVNKGHIIEIEEVTYFLFMTEKSKFSPNTINGVRKELETIQMFLKNTMRYCI